MTLKTIVNRAQGKLALPVSSSVVGNTDANVAVLLQCANEEGDILSRRHPWQALLKEQTFLSVAQEEQTNAFSGLTDMRVPKEIVSGSYYNRTRRRPVAGPLSVAEWQVQKALTANASTDSFRIRGNAWLASPVPAAGDTYAFEYPSAYWVDTDDDGMGDEAEWEGDQNTSLLSEHLIYLGIVWRFRKAREFPYAEDFNEYEKEVLQAIMRDGPRRTINFSFDSGDSTRARLPVVQEGDWAL